MDIEYGDHVRIAVSTALSHHLGRLAETSQLINVLTRSISSSALQIRLLNRLPICPPHAAMFRKSLASSFLSIPPFSRIQLFLTTLKTRTPFSLPKRNISKPDSIALKHAISIFDVAIAKPPPEDDNTTREIVKMLRGIDSEILDGPAFISRTECKKVLQGLWIRLDCAVHERKSMMEKNLDQFYH